MMSGSKSRLKKEKMTIKTMTNMYCKKKHGSEKNLCEECLDEEKRKDCKSHEERKKPSPKRERR